MIAYKMIIFTGYTQKDKVMAMGPRKYLYFISSRNVERK